MRIISWLFCLLFWTTNAFGADDGGKDFGSISWNLFFVVLSGVIGYIVGAVKSFREEKQKAYGEIIAPILKMAYHPEDMIDEKEYSKALSKLWLYGSKKVTRKMEKALEVMHDHSKGDVTRALQEAVVEMRKDIQLFSLQSLKPEEVNHLYTRIGGSGASLPRFESLRQIRAVTANIPPDLSAEELEEKLLWDEDFRQQLVHRLVRLFGLRNELIPYIETEIVKLIDTQLEPLFTIENGSYTLKSNKLPEFAAAVVQIRHTVAAGEQRLLKEYREQEKH